MTRHRYIKPDNLPTPIGLLTPLYAFVAFDYIGAPIWITSIIVFFFLVMTVTSVYLRFKGEPVDVLNQKVRP